MKKRIILGLVAMLGSIAATVVLAAPPPGALTVSHPDAWKGLTPDAIERVKKGEIVIANQTAQTQAGGQALIQVAMIFDVPIQEAFRILKEFDKQCDYMDSCDIDTSVEKTDTYEIVEFTVKVIAFNIKYRVKHVWNDKTYRIDLNLDPTFKNDLKHFEGFWQLYYIDDNHTLARYGTKLVVKDFVPQSVQETLTKRDLPTTLDAVKKRVNSHGTYKKKGVK